MHEIKNELIGKTVVVQFNAANNGILIWKMDSGDVFDFENELGGKVVLNNVTFRDGGEFFGVVSDGSPIVKDRMIQFFYEEGMGFYDIAGFPVISTKEALIQNKLGAFKCDH